MNLLNTQVWNNHSKIEQQLLSNDISPEEQWESELLFGVLRYARNERRERIAPSVPNTANGLKSIALRLLYAGGLLGRAAHSPGAWTSIADDETGSGGLVKPAMALANERGPYMAWQNMSGEVDGPGAVMAADTPAAPYRTRRETKRQVNGLQLDLKRQNSHIAGLLNLTTPAGNEEMKNNLRPAEGVLLVDRAVRALVIRPEGMAKMAFTLLRHSGLYGASPGERLTENAMHKIVNDWIMENLFGSPIETYVARQMREFLVARGDSPAQGGISFDVQTCREMIHNRLSPLRAIMADGDEQRGDAYHYLLDTLIVPTLPTLFFERQGQRLDSLELGTLDWCYLHIGLSFAAKSAVDVRDMTRDEIIEIGCSLSSMLMMGSLSAGLIELFVFPTLLFYLKSSSDEDKRAAVKIDLNADDTKKRALKHFFAAGETREYEVNPFKQFSSAMGGYKTRTELAKEILTKQCGVLAKEEYARRVDIYKTNPDDYHCPPYKTGPNGKIPDPAVYLPDLNQAFETQNQAIVDKFAIIDRLMILDVMAQMPEEEKEFLTAATARKAGADFSRLEAMTGMPEEYFITGAKPAVQLLPGIDLFLAAAKGEERIFALGRDESGYWLKRIDRTQENYYPLMEKNLAGKDKFFRLNIYSGEGSQGLYKPAGDGLAALFETLTAQHTKRLATQLYAQGYEETSREAFNYFMLSFIPFYHCAAWDPHRREEALISCVTDSLNLLPLAGQAAARSSNLMLKVGMGSAASVRAGAASYAAGSTLKSALSNGLRTFVDLALVSASEELDRKMLTGLLLDLAQAFDPGIRSAGTLGRSIVNEVRNAVRIVRLHSPAMEKLFLKMGNAASGDKLPAGIAEFETGRLAGVDHDIPIVRLGGDRYLNRPVFVRLNPSTGDVIGKKYSLSQDNQLVAVPLQAAVRLKNILHYGLSGRGAGKAAKVWNQQRSVDTLATVQLNGQATTVHISRYGEPGAEAVLFPELGISLSQEPLNVGLYEYFYRHLSAGEKIALTLWTETDLKPSVYSGGFPSNGQKEFMPFKSRINENLWKALSFKKWSPIDKHHYLNLVSALKRPLLKLPGSYLGVGQYPLRHNIPWADTIGPGDIVTSYPTFFGVSARDHYAKIFTAKADSEGVSGKQYRQAMVYFKIEGAQQCTPLITNIAASSDSAHTENDLEMREYLYPPNMFFRVKSIATVYLIDGDIHPSQRVGVVLEELIGPVNEAKNLYTGEVLPVTSMAWANKVKRYHEALL
ncbi:hypothetical protein [Sodalis sp. dw_96]|uniref:hypothetical protein n=1 Tax=Sodalis sp. dw_96 TaxID=2719794 RepID=UPI001BD6901D|nr:hypothetical protein [Sodalis sp. dw_96]